MVLQDLELVRIWDSLTYEDEEEDRDETGLDANGQFDAAQTRAVL